MKVGVGYSDHPDSATAARQAVAAARVGSNLERCDMALLFSTASHDALVLRDAVAVAVGGQTPVVGGWSVGAITNQSFGYAGDQVGLALLEFDGARCEVFAEGDLADGEFAVGQRLGKRLAVAGVLADTAVVLLYDTVDRTRGGMRLIMATPLLEGIQQSLGFLPKLVGAGLAGDMLGTPTWQWTGSQTLQRQVLALAFSEGGLCMDSAIMHGCQPATGYYTVTRADAQTVLEIDGEPALDFVRRILGPALSPRDYGFFVTLGVNKGNKWAAFDESSYVNRMCLKVDSKRRGLVMFEPDLVEGTQVQIMHRSVTLDYIGPRIERLFDGLNGRRPVFALYINCAGRAAGYAGIEDEDARIVQQAVADRVPLLGVYTGVEVGDVLGRPTALDWTGVFCLFSE